MVLSAIVMYFISYRLTNPILEINRVANEISNLNFSDKAIVNTEDEIGQLAISVNKMSRELENTIEELKVSNQRLAEEILYKNQVEKMRKEFIISASHELKTPLSLIMGYTEALKLEDLSKEDYDNYVDIITDETHKMNKLVREMLNISQIESGIISIQKEDFSIKKLVESTLKLVSIKLNENDIKYEMDVDDVMIHSDYDQLQTVLINFINNAINHIKEPKQLKIYSEKDKDKIRLLVFNTGQPILEEDITQLWDSFYKVDKARTRRYGGHGLGLSICRTIFEALNYTYGVLNLETGVAFYFDIKI
jgi:signal transduction histidine kinase